MNREPERGLADLERTIGSVLRWGTMMSSACFAVALAMGLGGYASGLATTLSAAGLVLLLATPVGRVIVSVVEYIRERDWLFVVLTLVVLAALGGSVAAAFWLQ